MRSLSVPDLTDRIKPFFQKAGYEVEEDKLLKVAPLIQPRIVTLEDAPEMGGFFFEEEVHPDSEALVGKKMTPSESLAALKRAAQILGELSEINHETAEDPMRALADELGLKAGQLFGILRVAITGQRVSPPLFESMEIVGKDAVLERIQQATIILENME